MDITMNQLAYPPTRKVEQVDNYHGTNVADPYRWLEDGASADSVAWIEAQNAVTNQYLAKVPFRQELHRRLEEVVNYPRYYAISRRGPYITYRKNDGLQNQLILYAQRGLKGKPEVVIDPNVLAPDGVLRLRSSRLSRDGRYLAYGLSHAGSDWEEYFVKDMETRQDLPERLRWVKCSTIAWRGHGFYYSRYPEVPESKNFLSARNEHQQVWYHRVGTPQSADELIHDDPIHPLRFHWVMTTEDERMAILYSWDHGAGKDGNAIHVLDAHRTGGNFLPVVESFDDHFQVVDDEGDKLLVLTNRRAQNWRLVLIDAANPDERKWVELIPEKEEPIDTVSAAGGKLLVIYRKDAAHRLCVFDRSGRPENEIRLPEVGLAAVFAGQRHDKDVFWSFTSFTVPTTIYRYDIATRTSSIFEKPRVQFNATDYETKQAFYSSKDGTRIPMFIVHRKALKLDGQNPALLYGYGGFGTSVGPYFDPLLIPLFERGVVYAVANLRGGGEYGEAWHHGGWRCKKQNTFDDFIAAAEWLQAEGYTRRGRCALHGASNGGLLVGAVITQRPDLCKVALPAAGPMDMLRFQKFTIGWNWGAEYGVSDDPLMFPTLLAYSPLHNIKEGVSYPATLVTTADHDDRIVPAHSLKFVATLQAKGCGPNPYLIRVDTQSGHGPVSLRKAVDERADIYAFMLAHIRTD